MEDYLIAKAIHIIFVVSYFAGIFYMVRLFIYHTVLVYGGASVEYHHGASVGDYVCIRGLSVVCYWLGVFVAGMDAY